MKIRTIVILALLGCALAHAQSFTPIWIAASGGSVPAGAFAAGQDSSGETLYVCRTTSGSGSTEMGKVRPGFSGCRYEFNYGEAENPNYSVLFATFHLDWAPASNGSLPADAIQAAPGVFICRAKINGGAAPGKIYLGKCLVEYGHQGAGATSYEVLRNPWKAQQGSDPPPADIVVNPFDVKVCTNGVTPGAWTGSTCQSALSSGEVSTFFVPVGIPSSWITYAGGPFPAGAFPWGTSVICSFGTSIGILGAPDGACAAKNGFSSVPFPLLQIRTSNLTDCTYQLASPGTSVGFGGGSGSVTLNTSDVCAWTAKASDSWVTITSPNVQSYVSSSGAIAYTVAPNPNSTQRTTTILAGTQTFTITQAGVPCTYNLSSSSSTPAAAGGASSVNVIAPASCAWTATSNAAWITINSGTPGSGNGTLNFTVAANPNVTPRSGTITVSNQTFTVNQAAAPCTFGLSAPSVSLAAGAAAGAVNVTAGPGCAWSTSAPDAWVSITSGASGSGNGTVNFTVAANPNASARTSILTIATQTFTVSQAAAACTFSLSASSTSAAAGGGPGSVNVITNGSSCAWSTSAPDAWVTISSGASGSGNGTVNFNTGANPSATARVTTLTIAGQPFTVNQAAAGCAFTLSATSATHPATGATATVAVTAPAGCAWTATSIDAWVVVTSGASGTGSGSVGYQVLANPGANARVGRLTIAGIEFVINQSGAQTGNQTTGLRFVPLEPCRVMETRSEYNFQNRTGAFGPPFVSRLETRTLNLPQSTVCQIPNTAKAYVLNVTLIPRGAVDFVTVFPAAEAQPTYWTVRSPDGQIVANSAIVKAGANGGISVYSSDNTDMIIDISGYFTDDANNPGFTYYPLTPCRVLDTRIAYRPQTGPFGPPTMNAGERRSFVFPSATQYCQVPQGAKAYSVTITVVPPGPLQFLTSWPTGGPQPNVSSINSPSGRTLANSVIVPASALGSIDAFVFDRSDVLLDITGYFGPDDGTTGLFYFPVTQCRAHDSQFNDEQAKTVGLASCNGVPATAKGYAANVTSISNGSPMPFLTLYPTGQGRPNASTLNAFEGQTITNSSIVPSGTNASIDVFAFRRTRVVLEISGYFGR